jgi:hypothetical protein
MKLMSVNQTMKNKNIDIYILIDVRWQRQNWESPLAEISKRFRNDENESTLACGAINLQNDIALARGGNIRTLPIVEKVDKHQFRTDWIKACFSSLLIWKQIQILLKRHNRHCQATVDRCSKRACRRLDAQRYEC